jgi:hypothetical protein
VEKDYSFFYFEKSLYSLSNPKSKIQNPKSLYQDVHNSNGNAIVLGFLASTQPTLWVSPYSTQPTGYFQTKFRVSVTISENWYR